MLNIMFNGVSSFSLSVHLMAETILFSITWMKALYKLSSPKVGSESIVSFKSSLNLSMGLEIKSRLIRAKTPAR